jgi:hypothetical protein
MAKAKKMTSAPSAKKEAAKAKKAASPTKSEYKNAGTLIAKKNRTGKLRFMTDYDVQGNVKGASKADKAAGKIIGTRMKTDRDRTATRAKGIAAREAKKAAASRRAKALGN